MKAKIIEKEKEVKFEPITIELTIESEEELCDLWHRLNIGSDFSTKDGYFSRYYLKYNACDSGCGQKLYDILTDCVNKKGLKNLKL